MYLRSWIRLDGRRPAACHWAADSPQRRSIILMAALASGLVLSAASSGRATTRVVRPDGIGLYPSIQAAINASAAGDTIRLTDGVFSGTGNRDLEIALNLTFISQSGDPARTELRGDPTHDGIAYMIADPGLGSTIVGVGFNGFRIGMNLPFGGDVNTVTLRHCVVRNCASTSLDVSLPLVAEDCEFRGNLAGSYGGAVQGAGAWTFTRCRFQDNAAQTAGGAVTSWSTDMTFQSCLFIDNHAGSTGGAVWNEDGGALQFLNCTFFGNVAPDASTAHSGYHTTTQFHNCIVAFGQGTPFSTRSSTQHFFCCDVYGNTGVGWTGCGSDGNICLDPLFCNPGADDFGLQSASPCAPFSPTSPDCDLMGALPVGCQSTGVAETMTGGSSISALRVFPNPAGGPVTIILSSLAPTSGRPILAGVYDAAGRLVRTLTGNSGSRTDGSNSLSDRAAAATRTEIKFDGRDEGGRMLPSGVYFIRPVDRGMAPGARLVLIR